jgi:hypothetical protein
MLKKGIDRGMRRWRAVALVATGIAIGAVMLAAPAGAHFGTVAHFLSQHADPRYANAVSGTDKAKNADKVDGIDSKSLRSATASAFGPSFNSVSTTEEDLASITINAPADGFIILTLQAEWHNDTANTYFVNSLVEGAAALDNWDSDAGDADGWYDQRQTYTHLRAVTAGSHTYTWRGRTSSGSATNWKPQIIALFVPAALPGAVSAVARPRISPN